MLAVFPNLGEKMLKLMGDAGEVGIDRLGLDVSGHVDNVEAERVGSGGQGETVEVAEGDVRVQMGPVR